MAPRSVHKSRARRGGAWVSSDIGGDYSEARSARIGEAAAFLRNDQSTSGSASCQSTDKSVCATLLSKLAARREVDPAARKWRKAAGGGSYGSRWSRRSARPPVGHRPQRLRPRQRSRRNVAPV